MRNLTERAQLDVGLGGAEGNGQGAEGRGARAGGQAGGHARELRVRGARAGVRG